MDYALDLIELCTVKLGSRSWAQGTRELTVIKGRDGSCPIPRGRN